MSFRVRGPVATPTVCDMHPTCDVIFPCRDEAAALPDLIPRVPPGYGIIVVDNLSVDGTAEVASALGAKVVQEPCPGYGAAVHAGLLASTAPYVAVLDGDGSLDPAELPALLAAVISGNATSGNATMAIGARRAITSGVWPWHARAGNAAVLWWLHRRLGAQIHDISPMRVCRRTDLLALEVKDRRFGYPVELLRRALQAGWLIVELDVSFRQRAAGTTSKISGSVSGSWHTALDFARALR